jgi:transposase
MSHANAQLTPRARLRLSRLVVDQGWTYIAAAKMFMVSPRTAAKWANRYRDEVRTGWPTAAPGPITARPRPRNRC